MSKRKFHDTKTQTYLSQYSFPQVTFREPKRAATSAKRSIQLTLYHMPTPRRSGKLAIIGSRNLHGVPEDVLFETVDDFRTWIESEMNMKIETIVSGKAKGADAFAEVYQERRNLEKDIYEPNRMFSSPECYHRRNQQIVDNSDVVLALWDMRSHGTKDTLRRAMKKKIPCYVFNLHERNTSWKQFLFPKRN